MKKVLIALLVIGLVFGMGSLSLSADMTKPLIIDIRTEAEWKSGHLEGAVLIPYEQIGERSAQLSVISLKGFFCIAEPVDGQT